VPDIEITNKLIGTLSEAYYKEFCDQSGWAYISLEQIHERGIKNGILKFTKGFDRIFVKIPQEIIPEIEEISKPSNTNLYGPSYVYDFLACYVGNWEMPHQVIENKEKKYFRWIEVKTGAQELNPNQIKTLKKISLKLYRFRVPYPLPEKPVNIYMDEVNSKYLEWHALDEKGQSISPNK